MGHVTQGQDRVVVSTEREVRVVVSDIPSTPGHEVDTSLPLLQPGRVAGWYRDPDDPLHHRYWTGDHWETERERLPRREVPGHGGEPPAPTQRQG